MGEVFRVNVERVDLEFFLEEKKRGGWKVLSSECVLISHKIQSWSEQEMIVWVMFVHLVR